MLSRLCENSYVSIQSVAVARPLLWVAAPRTRSAPAWSSASVLSVGFGLVLVALGAVQIVESVVGTLGWVAGTPLTFGVVPLLALIAGWTRFHDVERGPDIHDRQLDRIIGAGAALGAATLLLLSPAATGQRLDLLALPATAVAIIVSRFGTRLLWRLRAAPFALVLAWPTPWTALSTRLSGHLPAGAGPALITGSITGAVLVLPVALAARAGWLRRSVALLVAAPAGAAALQLVLIGGDPTARGELAPTLVLLVGAVAVVTVLLPLRLLCPTRAHAACAPTSREHGGLGWSPEPGSLDRA